MTRTASCRCGQLKAEVDGDPIRISVCHCMECKKRSGSAFAFQARYPSDQVRLNGASKSWSKFTDSGKEAIFTFCPDCGSDLYYQNDRGSDGQMAFPVGTFDDPFFARPQYSVFGSRKPDWLEIVGDGIEHD